MLVVVAMVVPVVVHSLTLRLPLPYQSLTARFTKSATRCEGSHPADAGGRGDGACDGNGSGGDGGGGGHGNGGGDGGPGDGDDGGGGDGVPHTQSNTCHAKFR